MTTGDLTPFSSVGGRLDQLIDPVTLDYVRTIDGEWLETADSRTIVLIQLKTELGASPFFPTDGTRIAALLRAGDPVTPEVVLADTLRAAGVLVDDGVITELTAKVRDDLGEVLRDAAGRMLVLMHWRDLAAGSPVDQAFQVGS